MTQTQSISIIRRRIVVDDVTIAYDTAGAGPALVLIHGLSGSARWWSRNIPVLAQHFTVYAIDLLGFGESRCAVPFVLGESANLIARWMDAVGIRRAHVIGHSMGGLIAAELAADFSDRVSRLVLVDAAAHPFLRDCAPRLSDVARALPRLPLGILPVLIPDALRAGPHTIMRATFELLMADIRPKLARIHAPTLVVWGENDLLVPLKLGKRLVGLLPRAEMLLFKGAGHSPMWQCPELFNSEIKTFLVSRRRRSLLRRRPMRTLQCQKRPAPVLVLEAV